MGTRDEFGFDVVVVGCGVAGTAAALAAKEAAASRGEEISLAIIERSDYDHRGANSRWTAAYLRMESVDQTARNFVDDMITFSEGCSDTQYIKVLADEAPATLQWVAECGVKFDYFPTMFLTSVKPRLLPVGGGRAIIDALTYHAEAQGVQIIYETTAWALHLDDEGAVDGLTVRMKGGQSLSLSTRCIILAAGGFEGNPEMMAQYISPDAHRLPTIADGGRFNKGEAIRMAMAVGAQGSGQWGSFHAEPIDPRSRREEATVMTYPYGILVDVTGKRFVDEGCATVDEQYESVARTIFGLPGHIAYLIADQKMFDLPHYEHALQTEQPPIQADSIAELGPLIGIPSKALEETVASYNAAIRPEDFHWDHKDGKCTTGITPPKSNWANPIDTPPYVAYPVVCSIVFTFGGLATDTFGRVLSGDDNPIPGLYAAGEITGLYYGKYPGATSVLRGLVFGKRSGAHAAEYSIARKRSTV